VKSPPGKTHNEEQEPGAIGSTAWFDIESGSW
jgi:hypothetical protein